MSHIRIYDDDSYDPSTSTSTLWKSDLFFTNEIASYTHNIIKPNVLLRIHTNGDVLYSQRVSLTLKCDFNLKYYPFDYQFCPIRIASCKLTIYFLLPSYLTF